ncbi:MAG: hypothetical protein PVSMB7_29200 [Chloroflexota bacterium]
MRIVIRGVNREISFVGDTETVSALVAACATEPKTLEALLLATEPYQRGIVDQVMGEMMKFDLWMQGGATKVRVLRPEKGTEPVLPRAFEVVDPLTRQLAYLPDLDGLFIIDLDTREITGPTSASQGPARHGSVIRSDETGEYEIETIYRLGHAWTLSGADVAREEMVSGA